MNIFKRIFGKKSKKVCVISIDGTPYSFVQKMIGSGDFPNFASLVEEGTIVKMRSSIPFVSCVAWTSFMTGKNPGKHGIFGFQDRRQNSYETYLPNANDIKADTIWKILSREGKKVIVMNVPPTYPPKPVNGILISCFLTPDLSKGVFPKSLYPKLKDMDYRIDIDPWVARQDKDRFLADLNFTLDKRIEALLYLMENEQWDFLMCHIMGTDRINHFLWEHWEKNDPKYAQEFVKFYKKVDATLGDIHSKLQEHNAQYVVLSDHGFCSVEKEIYLNYWLAQNGWLKFEKQPPENLADIHEDSVAYSMAPGRIYINLKGREPRGKVSPGQEYESIRDDIKAALMELKEPESGAQIVDRVYYKEEIYDGPLFEHAPDMVAMAHDGFDLKGALAKDTLTRKGTLVGMHTYADATLYIKDTKIAKFDPEIMDVMPTILKMMGMRIPEDVDGEVLI